MERELGVGESSEREMVGVPEGNKGIKVSVSQFMEKKSGSVELGGRKAATTPVLSAALANTVCKFPHQCKYLLTEPYQDSSISSRLSAAASSMVVALFLGPARNLTQYPVLPM